VTTIKKYNLAGKELGTVKVDERLATAEANGQMVKDYIVALRENLRQWSASTKTRSEVKCTNKKPRPQKGTGNARQGSFVAPQYRGGGIVFGPKPKFDQHVRINRKERKAAIRSLIGEKIRDGKVIVLADLAMKEPKTKAVQEFKDACGLGARTLFLSEREKQEVKGEGKTVSVKSDRHTNFAKSVRNLPKTEFKLAEDISGYDVMLAGNMVVTEEALKQLVEWLV
jgi:large subunit ribosomal protein L4